VYEGDFEGLLDDGAPNGMELRIGVAVTRQGSMVKELFPEWVRHFIKNNLLPGQGKGENPVILFVDGHSSRWSMLALLMLLDHNIWLICIPSHTSVWAQPNDAGPNGSFKGCLGRVVSRSTGGLQTAGVDRASFNRLLRAAYALWTREQAAQLRGGAAGSNSVTSGWRKVGLYPFNGNSTMWASAIYHFGEGSLLGPARGDVCGGGSAAPFHSAAEQLRSERAERTRQGLKHLTCAQFVVLRVLPDGGGPAAASAAGGGGAASASTSNAATSDEQDAMGAEVEEAVAVGADRLGGVAVFHEDGTREKFSGAELADLMNERMRALCEGHELAGSRTSDQVASPRRNPARRPGRPPLFPPPLHPLPQSFSHACTLCTPFAPRR